MFTIISSEFQKTYQRLTEPTVVTARWRTLGTWYPDGTQPDPGARADLRTALAEVARLKRELAARPAVSQPASNVRAAPSKIHVGTATYDSVPWKDRPVTPAKK